MTMMIASTISPDTTTAALRLIVYGNIAPIIPPRDHQHQEERPQ